MAMSTMAVTVMVTVATAATMATAMVTVPPRRLTPRSLAV